MRIALIGQKGIPAKTGGVEAHVENLAEGLVLAGHQVLVYTRPNYTDPQLKEYHGVKLISIPSIPSKHLDAISHTVRACFNLLKQDVDLVHFHSIGPSSMIWLVKLLRPNLPIITTFHTRCYEHQKWGLFARFCLRRAEAIGCRLSDTTITVSKTLQKYAQTKYKRNMAYIPNGTKINSLEGSDELNRWGLEKAGYVVAVSRLIRHKGLQHLIEAFKKIETDKKLVIVGDGAFTDKFVQEIKQQASKDKRIIFTGNQTGQPLAQLFSNAYLFIQPSESEGLSIALLEAMSYQKAVLISDIPENLEAVGEIADRQFVFKNKDSEDLRNKLISLLNQPELVEMHGKLNKSRAVEFYDWEKITEQVVDVYKKTLKNKKFFLNFKFKLPKLRNIH